MKKKVWAILTLSFLLMLSVNGCAPVAMPLPSPTYTITSAPANTPTTTMTPVPTPTFLPTNTTIPPTATITAPEKALEFLNNVEVDSLDTFDDLNGKGWELNDEKIINHYLRVIGHNWNGVVRDGSYTDNQGVIIDFTFSDGAVFEMLIDNGVWATEPYKRFGIYVENNSARVNVWVGENGLGGANLNGNFTPKPNTTYSLLMAVLPEGGFLGAIWDPAEPGKTIYYHEQIGKNWSNLSWTLKLGAEKGTIKFDNFREISFEGLK